MALSGLQIQKLLPKTNCKECGSNTCLAFAMKLAAKKAELSECPYASDAAKQVLGAASEPPVKGVRLGPDQGLRLGEETVLYRHEKTFVNQTALAVNVDDTLAPEELEKILLAVKGYAIERVGMRLTLDLVAVSEKSGDPKIFAATARRAFEVTGRPLVLRGASLASLRAAAEAVKGSRSVLVAATPDSWRPAMEAAAGNGHVLAVTAGSLDGIVEATTRLKEAGFNDLLVQYPPASPAGRFQLNSIARRAALRDNFKPLGYPSLCFLPDGDPADVMADAALEVAKYGSICVLPGFDPALLAALITLRLNLYTDPQKPIQVEPKLYAIGEPKDTSPVFVTTNFSLTYFMVSGEIENSGISAWLVVPECEGLSVLTAWAAGKFSGAHIAKFMKSLDLESRVKTREVVIPGFVSGISGELEEAMPGWKAVVGPQEAADIESFVKVRYKK